MQQQEHNAVSASRSASDAQTNACPSRRPSQAQTVYLGLGANLAEPIEQLRSAVQWLNRQPLLKVINTSSIYSNPAVTLDGSESQDEYFNAVIAVQTLLSADELLALIMQCEAEHGRVRSTRWAARELDIDLLDYPEIVQLDPKLTLPHPEIARRLFVLQPWADIDPEHRLATGQRIKDLLDACDEHEMCQLEKL